MVGLLRRLWTEPPAGHPFGRWQAYATGGPAEFERRYAAARARSGGEPDPGIARSGIELFRLLPATAARQVLLCTDLTGDRGRFACRMAGLPGLDTGRLQSWLFARCVQESVGVPHLRAAAIQLAP